MVSANSRLTLTGEIRLRGREAWLQIALGVSGNVGAGHRFGPWVSGWGHTTMRWPVFRCAAEVAAVIPSADPNYTRKATTNYSNELIACSYAINWSISQYSYGWQRRGFSKPKSCAPSEATLVMDCGFLTFGWAFNYFEWNIDAIPGTPYNWIGPAFRHPGERANMLCMDGHATLVQPRWKSGQPLFLWLWPNGDTGGLRVPPP